MPTRYVQVRATTDYEKHYFTEAMEEVYAAAVAAPKVRGKRLHDARAAALLHGVTMQDGPYREMANRIRKDYDTLFQASTEKLWTDLNAVFEHIRYDVNQVCSTKEDDGPEAKKMREELLAMLPEARDRLDKDIMRELARCREKRKAKMGE